MKATGTIRIATSEDHPWIRRIWEKIFTTDKQYLDTIFSEVFPYCKSYIYVENNEVLSVASLLPMQLHSPQTGSPLRGFYMFGVATLTKAQGRKLAANIIQHLSSKLAAEGYEFIFERPANQELNNYYLNLGFSIQLPKIPHKFNLHETTCSPGNNTAIFNSKSCAEDILNSIRENFSTRFEWENTESLEGLINLGELKEHNMTYTDTPNKEVYIAVKPLNKVKSSIFNNAFFCFPME